MIILNRRLIKTYIILSFVQFISFVSSDIFNKKIEIKSCTKLYNNVGSIGCGSMNEQDDGMLYEVNDILDFYDIKQYDFNIIVVADSFVLDNLLIDKLKENSLYSNIVGIITYDVDESINNHESPDKSNLWNRNGTGLLYSNVLIPLLWIDRNDASQIIKLSQENINHNKLNNQFSNVNYGRIHSYMGKRETMNSKQCLDWINIYGEKSPHCLPLGGQSVWGTTGQLDKRSKIISVAAIDSTADFHDMAYGANSAISSILVNLLAIESIGQSAHTSLPKQILFLLSNGETYGSIGSRAFLRDINNYFCLNSFTDSVSGQPVCGNPIRTSAIFQHLSNDMIDSVIAIDQIGILESSSENISNYYIHSYNNNDILFNIINQYISIDDNITISKSTADSLPPTPLDSFDSESITNRYVISGYNDRYISDSYHSRFDTSNKLSITDIVRGAQVLSKTLWLLAGGDINNLLPINTTTAIELFDCLSNSWDCQYFKSYLDSEIKRISNYNPIISLKNLIIETKAKPSYYIGVYTPQSGSQPVIQSNNEIYTRFDSNADSNKLSLYVIPNKLEAFIYGFMNFHLNFDRSIECKSSNDCPKCNILSYSNITQLCVNSWCNCPNSYYHNALDTGLLPDETPNYFLVFENKSSIYTEPYWDSIDFTVYKHSNNPYSGLISLIFGFASFIFAIYITLSYQKILIS